MVHPATQRAVTSAIRAIGACVDIGFIFPPKPGEDRGRGIWTRRDLLAQDVSALLPSAAAANARGAAIYLRLGPSCKEFHPGTIMLDDLGADQIERLKTDGFEPSLIVETSPGNFQAWIKLSERGPVRYSIVHAAIRILAERYDSDPRAVSPLQPGRLPGFTNRKPKYGIDGRYPFVRMIEANPGITASSGPDLISQIGADIPAQPGRAGGASPKTLPEAAKKETTDGSLLASLDAIHSDERRRVVDQVLRGTRPANAASQSEIDFAVSVRALQEGVPEGTLQAWLAAQRPEKSRDYAVRTLAAALKAIERRELPAKGIVGTQFPSP